jgi:hypothetical protein
MLPDLRAYTHDASELLTISRIAGSDANTGDPKNSNTSSGVRKEGAK